MMLSVLFLCMSLFCLVHCCDKGELLGTTITEEDMKSILFAHNNYRSMVAQGLVKNQPKARNMREMSWDDEIAKKAQDWADRCLFQHDSSSERKVDRFPVGQNLAIFFTSNNVGDKANFSAAIQGWFKEHNNFNYRKIQASDFANPSKQIGHYTQLVWADTHLVGCGYAFFYVDSWYKKLYVCNYGPSGNYLGQYPYVKGSPNCIDCNMKASNNYKGLCV